MFFFFGGCIDFTNMHFLNNVKSDVKKSILILSFGAEISRMGRYGEVIENKLILKHPQNTDKIPFNKTKREEYVTFSQR